MMTRTVVVLIHACMSMVVAAGGAVAQAAPDTARQEPIELDRIVVTATRVSVPAVIAAAARTLAAAIQQAAAVGAP